MVFGEYVVLKTFENFTDCARVFFCKVEIKFKGDCEKEEYNFFSLKVSKDPQSLNVLHNSCCCFVHKMIKYESIHAFILK